MFTAELVYINDDNVYSYTVHSENYYPYTYSSTHFSFYAMGVCIRNDDNTARINYEGISSLEEKHLAMAFELPDGSLNANDGTLALCLTFDTEKQERYILVLREDGNKVGDW